MIGSENIIEYLTSLFHNKWLWGSLIVILLVGGVVAIVYLTQIQQIFRSQADENVQNETPGVTDLVGEVDLAAKKGEFLLEDPKITPQVVQQILLEGSYDPGKREIILTPSEYHYPVPPEYDPHMPEPSNAFPLTVKMISNGNLYFEREIHIVKDENKGPIPFEVRLPYLQSFELQIYERQTHVTTQQFSL